MVGRPSHHEEEIRQAIHIYQDIHRGDFVAQKRHDFAFSPSADGTRQMQSGRGFGATWKNEGLQRRQFGFELVDGRETVIDVRVIK